MNWRQEWKWLALMVGGFLAVFYLPVGSARFDGAVLEAFHLVKWYAREHVLLCLIPALFIAGAIAVFVSQAAVMKYLGPTAHKGLAYGVASVSGTVLAVCSCTVLPLFAGIYRMGAGIGPASAFLYAGPAINVLAIILTARVIGLEMGIARAVGAIGFSVVVGLLMHILFRHEEQAKVAAQIQFRRRHHAPARAGCALLRVDGRRARVRELGRPGRGHGILARRVRGQVDDHRPVRSRLRRDSRGVVPPAVVEGGGGCGRHGGSCAVAPGMPLLPFGVAVVALSLATATQDDESKDWFVATWEFAKQILPLLLLGVLLAGLLLGRVGHEGLIPSVWVTRAVGGNSIGANLFAAVAGAFMYFATLTEVPILQGLIGSGMGKGPALALLLAGPALSLPSMLVLKSIMGLRKTATFVGLVVVMATASGLIYGWLF